MFLHLPIFFLFTVVDLRLCLPDVSLTTEIFHLRQRPYQVSFSFYAQHNAEPHIFGVANDFKVGPKIHPIVGP